jgi:deoxyribonuclease V
MIAIFDVDYQETQAQCACLVIENWNDTVYKTYTKTIDGIAEYESGSFYKRELPCILETFALIEEKIDLIVIDGYVNLGEKKGLGHYLYEALAQQIPIIGVAKTKFLSANALELLRGESKNPLYITSEGIDNEIVRQYIASMNGDYRIPFVLKEVDRICRIWLG